MQWNFCMAFLLAVAGHQNGLCEATTTQPQLNCGSGRYACGDGSGCVSADELCDFSPDCPDASDELNFNLCKERSKHIESCDFGKVYCENLRVDDFSWAQHHCISISEACDSSIGAKCNDEFYSICKELTNNKLKPTKIEGKVDPEAEKFRSMMRFVAKSFNETKIGNWSECPPFYTTYNDKCISVFTPVKIPWSAAQLFCESTSGQLVSLSSLEDFKTLLDFLKISETTSQFWIGGFYDNSSASGWTWLDGSSVEMGAPFWSMYCDSGNRRCSSSSKKLSPQEDHFFGYCLAILDENFYYFSNELCENKYSPICIADKNF